MMCCSWVQGFTFDVCVCVCVCSTHVYHAHVWNMRARVQGSVGSVCFGRGLEDSNFDDDGGLE